MQNNVGGATTALAAVSVLVLVGAWIEAALTELRDSGALIWARIALGIPRDSSELAILGRRVLSHSTRQATPSRPSGPVASPAAQRVKAPSSLCLVSYTCRFWQARPMTMSVKPDTDANEAYYMDGFWLVQYHARN